MDSFEKRYLVGVAPKTEGLDPVTVIFDDIEDGRGQILVNCYDKAWYGYWGSIGQRDIIKFVSGCNADYLFNNISRPHEREFIADIDQMTKDIEKADLDYYLEKLDEPFTDYLSEWENDYNSDPKYVWKIDDDFLDALSHVYGSDMTDMPLKRCSEGKYLFRICKRVIALAQSMSTQTLTI